MTINRAWAMEQKGKKENEDVIPIGKTHYGKRYMHLRLSKLSS